jgi:hypothetical protein
MLASRKYQELTSKTTIIKVKIYIKLENRKTQGIIPVPPASMAKEE